MIKAAFCRKAAANGEIYKLNILAEQMQDALPQKDPRQSTKTTGSILSGPTPSPLSF